MPFITKKKIAEEGIGLSKKQHRYVAQRNIERMKTEGWRIIDIDYSDLKLANAALKIIRQDKDIVLMEK